MKKPLTLQGCHVTLQQAQARLRVSGNLFEVLLAHGSLSVELYQPHQIDHQTPHTRDEVYFIATGSGKFRLGSEEYVVQSGDFLFVPAYAEHRVFDFSPNFST